MCVFIDKGPLRRWPLCQDLRLQEIGSVKKKNKNKCFGQNPEMGSLGGKEAGAVMGRGRGQNKWWREEGWVVEQTLMEHWQPTPKGELWVGFCLSKHYLQSFDLSIFNWDWGQEWDNGLKPVFCLFACLFFPYGPDLFVLRLQEETVGHGGDQA